VSHTFDPKGSGECGVERHVDGVKLEEVCEARVDEMMVKTLSKYCMHTCM